jgi:hypothetical protein
MRLVSLLVGTSNLSPDQGKQQIFLAPFNSFAHDYESHSGFYRNREISVAVEDRFAIRLFSVNQQLEFDIEYKSIA